jgi:hypothetical protein
VPGDDALHDRQADAGALELAGAVQPLEHAEEPLGVLRVEADPGVPDGDHRLAGAVRVRAALDLDPGRGAAGGELARIAQQVDEDLPEQPRIGRDGGQLGDPQLEPAGGA